MRNMVGLLYFWGYFIAQDIKPFKTIEEQITILEDRGLIIEDEEYAKKALANLNYYRLSAYTLTLRRDDCFYDNVKFSDVMQIYSFDMEIKATKQLFAYLIVMKKMIPDERVWNTFTSKLVDLKNKYPFVRLDYYGFTEEWEKLLGIKKEKQA